jgi:aryl-alcohol dehydrogenase-like predicted oxidoreductase
MAMSDLYGPADDAESIATIQAALDAGVTLLDTGDYYGMGHNELLIRDALKGRNRDGVVISVKCGALRDPSGNWLGIDGRPASVKTFLAYTLRRLGTSWVDIYRLGRVDPAVPIEETVGAMAEMVQAGSLRYIGLSEAGPETIRRAHRVHPISDLQIEYSLMSRGIERDILPVCRELGIGITAYGVLSLPAPTRKPAIRKAPAQEPQVGRTATCSPPNSVVESFRRWVDSKTSPSATSDESRPSLKHDSAGL